MNEIKARPEPILTFFSSTIMINKYGTKTKILNNTKGIALLTIFVPEKVNTNFENERKDVCSYKPQKTIHDKNERIPIKVHHRVWFSIKMKTNIAGTAANIHVTLAILSILFSILIGLIHFS